MELLVIKNDKAAKPDLPLGRNNTVQDAGTTKQAMPQKALSIGPNSSVPEPVARTFSLTLIHLGRQGGTIVLSASSEANRISWFNAITAQKAKLTETKSKFEIITLADRVFPLLNRVNASTTYQGRLILGTESGLFVRPEFEDEENPSSFVKVLDVEKVMQVDVLPDYDMLLVLADRTFLSFPLEMLNQSDDSNRKGKKIGSSVSFFKLGVCSDRTFVCAVKSTTLTATVKVLEPVGLGVTNLRGKLGKLFRAPNEPLRVFKEFYIPTESRSIHYLKTKLCVGCAKGFEIVDLDSLNTQGLLDPSDEKLDFVLKRETVKPIAIFRVKETEFLLCYNGIVINLEFGFYVDKFGRRSRPDWLVHWAGQPYAFSFIYPYVITFEPSFIEIRDVETGALQQILATQNLRTLNVDANMLDCVMASNHPEFQHIFRLQLISD